MGKLPQFANSYGKINGLGEILLNLFRTLNYMFLRLILL